MCRDYMRIATVPTSRMLQCTAWKIGMFKNQKSTHAYGVQFLYCVQPERSGSMYDQSSLTLLYSTSLTREHRVEGGVICQVLV